MEHRHIIVLAIAAALSFGPGVVRAEDAPAPDAPGHAPSTQPAKVSPDARTLLDQLSEAYLKLKSLSLTGTLSSDIDAAGQSNKQSTTFTASYSAPNKFRHAIKDQADEMVWGSTGEKAYSYLKSKNIYTSSDAAKEKAETKSLPSPLPQVMAAQNPSLQLAVAKDPASELTSGASSVSKGDDTKIGDNAYPTLSLEMNDKRHLTLLMDPRTHLLRQARTDVKPVLEERGTPDVKHALITVDYLTVTPDAPVENEQFAWKPPQGARDLAAGGGGGEEGAAASLEGKTAPDFKLEGMDGKTVTLASVKGSVTILDFWATWCGPCRQSLPHLNKVYDENKAAGLKVYAVNLQEDKGTVQKFVEATKLGIPVLLDTDGSTAQNYAAQAIPETVLIGKDGVIKKVFVGFSDQTEGTLRKAIESALAEK